MWRGREKLRGKEERASKPATDTDGVKESRRRDGKERDGRERRDERKRERKGEGEGGDGE